MPPAFATVVFALGILGLFRLDRDPTSRTSKALWIPVVWVSIAGSRMVSQWLQMAPPRSTDQYLDGSPLDRYLLAALVALGIIALVRRGPRIGPLLRANWPILLFYSYCLLSVLWSDYPEVAFKRWTKALGDLVMVLVVLTDPDCSSAIKRFLARAGFLLLPVSVLLIRYYPELGRGYRAVTQGVWEATHTGVTMDKNMLGMVCLVFGIGCVWRFLEAFRNEDGSRRKGSLIAHGAVVAMVLWLFRMANSMTSLACFVLGSGVILATGFPRVTRKRATLHFLVVAVLSVAFSVLFLNVGTVLLEIMGRDPTLTGRTDLWDRVLNMTVAPLIGTGFESFWLGPRLEKLWDIYWWRPNEAHNGYLEVFLNLGWMGAALLAVVMVTGYRNVVGAFGRDPAIGRLCLAYFVAVVAYNFSESAIKAFHPAWIAFLLAIIGSTADLTGTGRTSKSSPLSLTGEETFSANRG
jgi:exopolysaccharide production protein ExoQ